MDINRTLKTGGHKMTTLREILNTLPETALLNDGATTWDAENLLDALQMGDDPEQLNVSYTWDGKHLCRVGDDGFLVQPGEYRLEDE